MISDSIELFFDSAVILPVWVLLFVIILQMAIIAVMVTGGPSLPASRRSRLEDCEAGAEPRDRKIDPFAVPAVPTIPGYELRWVKTEQPAASEL